ncbi:MAG TPA: tetratricopeptide repeat protein [Pyrinomonadaceae bacterium]|nr:tetratricopeptide repeat protein [Pyrinomonadaceae bacterium]
MSRQLHVPVALILVISFSSGCTSRLRTLFAQGVNATDQRKDAPTLSKESYDLIVKGDYEGAIRKAELAIKKDPNFALAHKNLAIAYCDSGLVEKALEPIQKALSLDPNLDTAYYVYGKTLFKLQRLNEAITQFQKAIRINPKYSKAYYLMGRAYDLSNNPQAAEAALDQAVQLKPDDSYYRWKREYVVAYARQKNQKTLPAIVPIAGKHYEHAHYVYSGIFYEALIHRDFDLIDKAADQARTSKERLPGGNWKLAYIYPALDAPYEASSDYEWNQHLDLLKQWTREKPNSVTAKVALASGYIAFAWRARGNDYSHKVSQENWKLFRERLAHASDVLKSAHGQQLCPKWYGLVQQVALGQGWDRETYEELFTDAVKYEPTWFEYYKHKAVYLLPQWHGEEGELDDYINALASRPDKTDGALLYFILNEYIGTTHLKEKMRAATNYPLLKQGFIDLRKTYGASPRHMNWAAYKAILANDRTFAREIFADLKGDADLQIWGTQQAFDGAKMFSEVK